MDTLGVLVTGLGPGGLERAAASAMRTRRLRLVAVHDRDPIVAEQVAARHGVVALADLAAGLDSRGVDVVIVATPPGEHDAAISQALRAGKQVFAEAPLTTKPRGGRILARRAADVGLRLATGSEYRFDPPVRDALLLLESWAIGRVESIRVEVGHRASFDFLQSWRTDVGQSGGGCLMHHGPVACDLIRRVLGEVVLAKGFVRQDIRLPPGCETTAFGLFRNHDNAFAELHASWNLARGGLRFEIRGEAGWLLGESTPSCLSGQLSDGRQLRRRYRAAQLAERWHRRRFGCGRATVAELDAFADWSNLATQPLATGWDGSRVTEMIQAIYQSNRTGDEVHLSPSLVPVPFGLSA